ncbi:MMPL family transporter [Nocardioides sp. zg-ZUI104]|uniref:MMPL family transporter n=1 Tax=Nocardioides faecalis TaxID=2803858 RepID=UPI001BCE30E5|nr:MMPL family transporter [Nocardioides faecalis]MBS4754124.1 MMPL family transporter [Nocardioides faecalis]
MSSARDTDTHGRLGRLLLPRRGVAWAVAIVPLLAAIAFMALIGSAAVPGGATDELPDDADSTLAVQLQEQLPDEDTSTAIAVFSAGDPGDSAGDKPVDDALVGELQQLVDGVRSDLSLPKGPPVTASEDGTAALAVLPVPGGTSGENRDLVTDLRSALKDGVPEGVSVEVTGPAAVMADLSEVFQGADATLLATTAGVVALLLLITYRSPILWIIPLTVVAIADRLTVAVATQSLDVLGMVWNNSTTGILSVLVFGAGTDYALLLISRYREELKTNEDRYVAMRRATARTAEAVLSSAVTVFLGLLTLVLSVFPNTRGLGVACAIGIVIAAAFVLLVLPSALVLFGRWVFWPKVPHVGDRQLVDGRGLWRRVGDGVNRRPVALVVLAGIFLAALASGTLGIQTGLSGSDKFLDEPEAITAAERLAESFPAGNADPVEVLTREDPQKVLAAVEGVDGVVAANPSTSGNGVAQVDVVIEASPGEAEAEKTVDALRDAVADLDQTYVGGTHAELIDSRDASDADLRTIVPVLSVLVLLALVVLLRSLVAPVLLVGTVLATYLASLGLSWWLFTGVFGFESLDVSVPLLAFVFLVALGVDYNIFLVTRGREEARQYGTAAGMLRALTVTGGVITSAGILLAAVFAVLGVLPLVVLAQFGVVICIGVLLDTLLVRTVVVPALAVWLGDRFWWPKRPRSHA